MANNTKSKQKESGGGLVILLFFLALLQLIFFFPVSLVYHRQLMKRYFSNCWPSAQRINDFAAVRKPFTAILFGSTPVLLLYWMLATWVTKESAAIATLILLLASPLLLLWLWLSVIFFRWLAVAHFGVVVDPENDRIVFQFDQESYDLMDYLKLKFIRDLPRMDEVRLSDIGRITRKFGWDLYILGSFGSRRITFTNKQKRDECIYAIQKSGRTSAKVPIEFGI